ncbi:MAG: uracil phosphoribosyltransferase [Patescibacteria group bacterium]
MTHRKTANTPLDVLRDRQTGTAGFRAAARRVCSGLMQELQALLRKRNVDTTRVAFVIVLRSAIALLEPALQVFPQAPVGVLGLKRDEHTLLPRSYYENLPTFDEYDAIILLDPMLATGGSTEAAIARLLLRGAAPEKLYFVGVIAAPEGLARLCAHISREHIILAAVDEKLDPKGMIVPGLGDFGDRYFGYGDAPVSFD